MSVDFAWFFLCNFLLNRRLFDGILGEILLELLFLPV